MVQPVASQLTPLPREHFALHPSAACRLTDQVSEGALIVVPRPSRLTKHHLIRVKAAPPRQGAGRSADPVYEVNPRWPPPSGKSGESGEYPLTGSPNGNSPDLLDSPDGERALAEVLQEGEL
jgi:hypothetical protein